MIPEDMLDFKLVVVAGPAPAMILADNVLSKIKMDYRRSSCSAQTDFIIRIIF